jgi:hypothetical protein
MASLDADQEAEMESVIRELEAENRYGFTFTVSVHFCGRETCGRRFRDCVGYFC